VGPGREPASRLPHCKVMKASSLLFYIDHTSLARHAILRVTSPQLNVNPLVVLWCGQAWGGASAGVPAVPRGGASCGHAKAGGTGAETPRGQGPATATQARGRRFTFFHMQLGDMRGSNSCVCMSVHLSLVYETACSSLFCLFV
jgi:hypothetical protein